jgi:hypothetical protein
MIKPTSKTTSDNSNIPVHNSGELLNKKSIVSEGKLLSNPVTPTPRHFMRHKVNKSVFDNSEKKSLVLGSKNNKAEVAEVAI